MKIKLFFVIILVLAVYLRFSRLGSFPAAMTWDEAAIGYNAWGILTIHRDEWLNRLPLSFKSFGDYKSPLDIYLTAISEKFFGLDIYAVRFPVALAGVGLVVVSYFLTSQILSDIDSMHSNETKRRIASLVTMFLVAISPWALHFSMIGFESMTATFLVSLGVLGFLKGLYSRTWFMISAICMALSLYAYHSPKLVVPCFLVILCFVFRRQLISKPKKIIFYIILFGIITVPLLYSSVRGNANKRLVGSSVIFNNQQQLKPLPQIISILSKNYVAHLNPKYLFGGKETTYRQSNFKDGIFSPVEIILAFISVVWIVRTKKLRTLIWIPLFFLVSILPATLGADVPHANRALLGLPWIQILAGIGVIYMDLFIRKRSKNNNSLLYPILYIVIVLVGIVGLVRHEQFDTSVYTSYKGLVDMQYGYDQAIAYSISHENQFHKIFFTNHYGQAYIFILFYKRMNPIDYQGGGLANYTITDNPWFDAQHSKDVLIVGTKNEIPDSAHIVKEVRYPDGTVAFRIAQL